MRHRRAAGGLEQDFAGAARKVAEEVRHGGGWDLPISGRLGDISVVEVDGGPSGEGVPGLLMRWTQGDQAFGLVASLPDLIRQAGALDAVASYLVLALDEPHGRSADGGEVWFTRLPSAPV